MNQVAPAQLGIGAAHLGHVTGKQVKLRELFERDQAGPQAIVDIVIVVGDFIGRIADLRLEGGLLPAEKTFTQVAELAGVVQGTMLDDSFSGFETEVQAGKRGVALFEQVNRAQTLQIVFETAVFTQTFVQRVLPGMAEGRVAKIVRERYGFDQVFVDSQGTRDLGHLEAVRQARAKQVAFMIDEYLGLVLEAPESRRMYDAIAVALELVAVRGRGIGIAAPA